MHRESRHDVQNPCHQRHVSLCPQVLSDPQEYERCQRSTAASRNAEYFAASGPSNICLPDLNDHEDF
jgi:hypothetical protein